MAAACQTRARMNQSEKESAPIGKAAFQGAGGQRAGVYISQTAACAGIHATSMNKPSRHVAASTVGVFTDTFSCG